MKENLMYLVVIVIIAGVLFFIPRSNRSPASSHESPKFAFFMRLIEEHPDPKISEDLRREWRDSEVWVTVEKLGPGVRGSLLLLPGDEAERDYNIPTDREIQPILAFGEAAVERAMEDEMERRMLIKTVRHEYEHYLQWKRGTAFQEYEGDDPIDYCTAIWEREYPVYRDDCYRVERWWPGEPLLPEWRCKDKDDPIAFGLMLKEHLGTQQPECREIWGDMIRDME